MMDMSMMSPERIALKYDGNKQKIAAAAQAGLLDPTSAVMAGMFIDRMRNAAIQEQTAPTTVEQDVLGAPQIPAGLGATPQAQQQAAFQEKALQVVPPSQAGLAALPVDESMVPGGEGYAGGGIVAFNGDGPFGSDVDLEEAIRQNVAGRRTIPTEENSSADRGEPVATSDAIDTTKLVEEPIAASGKETKPEPEPVKEEPVKEAPAKAEKPKREIKKPAPAEEKRVVTAPTAPPATSIKPGKQYSLEDLISAATERRKAVGLTPEQLAAEEYAKSAATRAKEAKSRGLNEFLAQMGFAMAASKSPRFMQAAGEAGMAAMPRLSAAAKEARELEEAGVKSLAEMGRARRLEELAGITAGEKAFTTQEEIAARLAAAQLGQKELNAAELLRRENPEMSFLDSLAAVSQAMHPKDTYNATRTAVTAASTAASRRYEYQLTMSPELRALDAKAMMGDKEAAKRIREIRDALGKEELQQMQLEGVDLSRGRLGPAAGGGGGPSLGQVDKSNPLLR